MNYKISGNGLAPLVLVHGYMEDLSIWDKMIPHLSQDFKIIRVDLPGHGNTPLKEEVSYMDQMASDLKALLKELEMDKFHLLGHSMGGYVSLAYANMFPSDLESLTLFYSTFFADTPEKKEIRRKSFRPIQENFKTYAALGIPPLFGPNEREKLKENINFAKRVAQSTDPNGALAAVKGMIERPDTKQVVSTLECKILVLSGKHDTAVNSMQLLQALPEKSNIRSYLLDTGHNGHLEKPKTCAAIINEELLD